MQWLSYKLNGLKGPARAVRYDTMAPWSERLRERLGKGSQSLLSSRRGKVYKFHYNYIVDCNTNIKNDIKLYLLI